MKYATHIPYWLGMRIRIKSKIISQDYIIIVLWVKPVVQRNDAGEEMLSNICVTTFFCTWYWNDIRDPHTTCIAVLFLNYISQTIRKKEN